MVVFRVTLILLALVVGNLSKSLGFEIPSGILANGSFEEGMASWVVSMHDSAQVKEELFGEKLCKTFFE